MTKPSSTRIILSLAFIAFRAPISLFNTVFNSSDLLNAARLETHATMSDSNEPFYLRY